jgi:hypothetical protein
MTDYERVLHIIKMLNDRNERQATSPEYEEYKRGYTNALWAIEREVKNLTL